MFYGRELNRMINYIHKRITKIAIAPLIYGRELNRMINYIHKRITKIAIAPSKIYLKVTYATKLVFAI